MQMLSRVLTNQNYGLLNTAKISRTHSRQRHFKVVMVAHGASTWSEKNRFCGWYDAPLSRRGRTEAIHAGRALKQAGFKFDIAFTSFLARAQTSLNIILEEIGELSLPVVRSWRLNEKHCGALTGLTIDHAREQYGQKELTLWHTNYEACPPPMKADHKYHASIVEDPRYLGYLSKERFPIAESFKMVSDRALVFWHEVLEPIIQKERRVLIVGHRNSLRGIIQSLDKVPDEDAMKMHIPAGIPFVFHLNFDLEPLKDVEFLSTLTTTTKEERKKEEILILS